MEILAVSRERLGVHVGEMVGTDFEEFMEASWDFEGNESRNSEEMLVNLWMTWHNSGVCN